MIGYAAYYKDQDGYEIILGDHQLAIFHDKDVAERWAEEYKEVALKLWRPAPTKITTGHLWWKNHLTVTSDIDPIQAKWGRQVYNTIAVKRVNVA